MALSGPTSRAAATSAIDPRRTLGGLCDPLSALKVSAMILVKTPIVR
jgi:hypothetical protein